MDTRHRCTANHLPSPNSYEILELDVDPTMCVGMCCSSELPRWTNDKHSKLPLYKYNEIPEFMKGNPYLLHGYRGQMNTQFCLKR